MVRLIAAIALVSGTVPAAAVTHPGVDHDIVVNAGLVADPALVRLSAIDARALAAVVEPSAFDASATLALATRVPARLPVAPVQTTVQAIDGLLPDGLTLAVLALGLALFAVLMRRRVPTVSA